MTITIMSMQTLTCYYIKIVEFNYDMPVFNQITDGHIDHPGGPPNRR